MSSGSVDLGQTFGSGGGGGGVTSLNSLTGALSLVAGTGITITPSGSTITIANTGAGSGTVTSVSLVAANGLSGTVANPTTTPAITLLPTFTGIAYSTGSAFQTAIASNFPTLNQNTTGTAANVTATSNSTLTTLSLLSLPTSQLSGSVSLTTQVSGALPIANGGTNATTASAAYNNLSPMTTTGDIEYEVSTGAAGRLAIGTSGQVLAAIAGAPSWQSVSALSTFTGDSGSGGTAGIVPAPPSGSFAAGEYLNAGGSFTYVDTTKTINPTFSLIDQAAVPSGSPGTIKYESTTVYTSIVNGKNYAIGVGFIGTPTLTVWDISDQTSPVLTGYINESGGGAYNCTVGVVSGVQYAFVGYNSGSKFVVFNLTNPYSLSQTSSTVITGTPGSIYGVSFLNGYVYCATQSAGLVVMDVGGGTGSPTLPVQTFTQGSPYKSFGVVAVGTNVYTTYYSTSSPFTVRDILSWTLTSPGSASVPSLLQTLQVTAAGEALGLSVSGNTAFVTTATTGAYNINLVDITTPSSMTNLSTINSSNSFGSAFYAVRSGNILYVPSGGNATYGGALDAYDITNRSAPIHIAQATTGNPTSVFGVPALSNGYLFVADYGIVASNNGYLDVFTQLASTFTFGNAVGSSLTVNIIDLVTKQTTYTGSSSGTAVWSMPDQGSSYKKFIIYLASLTDAGGTITFPTPFTQTPYLYGASAVTGVSSVSTTTFTLSSTSAISGFAFVEGY